MPTFTEFLRSSSDERLAALLARRPDLASPSPGNLTSLAVRATGRASLERALAAVDAVVVQVLEATLALGGATPAGLQAAIAGAPDPDVVRATADALDLALLYPGAADGSGAEPVTDHDQDLERASGGTLRLAPGVAELLGAHPAGLAVDVVARGSLADLSDEDALAGAARAVLDALAWGPPVGLAPAPGSPPGDAVALLVDLGLLVRGAGRHVLLPASVALELRGGRTHRGPARAPDLADVPHRPTTTVAVESASAGERCVRLVGRLLRHWEHEPPGVLRAGGLAVRELRRTAQLLEVDEVEAAFVVELAYAAGLLAADDDEPAAFVPTTDADPWWALDLPERWTLLASAWFATTRTPWLVGTRDDRGSLIAALDPELARPWAPRLRRSVLDVLAPSPGAAPDADRVVEVLGWATPRSVPPRTAVEAVLREAALLGVTGAGALGEPARALAEGDAARAGALFSEGLAPEVSDLLVQGDLTGIVPGRPSPALETLLDQATDVESRGGALTVRFTPGSVRRALDDGLTADELLDQVRAFALGPLPQALEYLVRDAARRHGRLRAGAASSYVRADDPALLAGLADDPRLAELGLVQLAPTVLAAQASTHEVVEALRAHGLSPVAETPDGQVLHLERTVRRARRRGSRRAPTPHVARPTDTSALVRRLRTAEQRPSGTATAAPDVGDGPGHAPRTGATAASPPTRSSDGGTDDPAAALALLREAAAAREDVWVELVGPSGTPERRLLRPLRVDGGRLRAADPGRESELTVAVHRIAHVQRAEPTRDEVHEQEIR